MLSEMDLYLFQKECSASRICSSCSGSRVILLSSDAPGMPATSFRMRLPNFSGANRAATFNRVSMASFLAAMEAEPQRGSRASREASSDSSRHSSIMMSAPATRARWEDVAKLGIFIHPAIDGSARRHGRSLANILQCFTAGQPGAYCFSQGG